MTLLNIGCGNCLKYSYTNVDIESPDVLRGWAREAGIEAPDFSDPANGYLQFDLLTPWTFAEDNSVSAIIADNMLEHFDHAGVHHILCEAYRVLVPGAAIRGRVPDFGRIWQAFVDNRDWEWDTLVTWGPYQSPAANALYNFCYSWGHKNIFTRELLKERLSQFGFDPVDVYPEDEHKLFFHARK